jgi:hypothetical protein
MNGSNRYVLDANVFIQAKNSFYSFDICPGFWHALIAEHSNGRLCSIDQVRKELLVQKDALSVWVKESVPKTFFESTEDQAVITAFQTIVNWVNAAAKFTPAAKAEFAAVADGWLVAFAKAKGLTVVTRERSAPDAKKPKIPNLCDTFDVSYVDTFEMLKDLKVEFALRTKR